MNDQLSRFLRAVGPDHDAVQAEMADHADDEGFPIVGPESGGVLRLLARLVDAGEVFEFGSGFGYSASWFARGMDGGRVVLTERDADELALGRDFLARGDYGVEFAFEEGDAFDAFERYDGPFDVVLLDHEKARYAPAFARVRPAVREGGVVVADNVVRSSVRLDLDRIVEALDAEGDGVGARSASWDVDTATEGVASYLDLVRRDPAFETVVLPVGKGLAVSVRVDAAEGDGDDSAGSDA